MDKREELIMRLVHYFITEQNYNPIVVNGVKDEIWLENSEGPYYIVRINSNNIFNKEQLDYDHYKTENIVKQIKKKTFSFNVNTLNILLDLNKKEPQKIFSWLREDFLDFGGSGLGRDDRPAIWHGAHSSCGRVQSSWASESPSSSDVVEPVLSAIVS